METKYTIKKQFLDASKYQQILREAQNYESLFKSWLGRITEDYRGPKKPSILLTSSTLSIDLNMDTIAEKMQSLIYPFVHSLYDISSQHLQYVSQVMRQSVSISFQKETETVISLCNKFESSLNNFENIFKEMIQAENRLILSPTHSIEFFFYDNWKKRQVTLEKYSKSIKSISQKDFTTQHLYKQSEQLETQLLDYRKKLINHKYGYLKQGVKTARKLLSCLAEYLSIGNQMLIKINSKLKENMTSDLRNSRSFIEQNGNLSGYHQNFALRVQAYRETLINIQSMFMTNQNVIDTKQLIHQFNEAYSGNEQLLMEMFDVFNLFEALGVKKRVMVDRVNITIHKLQNQYKDNKKAVQVLTTLNRHSSSLQNSERLKRSEVLKPEITNDIISKSLNSEMENSLETFRQMSRLCLKVTQKTTQIKNSQNNMSISYEYKEIKVRNKRPNKKQMWLWKDWREFRPIEPIKPKYDESFINKQMQKVQNALGEDDFEMKASCDIEGRYSCGARMFIYPEKIKIQSKRDEKICFILSFTEMDSVEIVKKKLLIKMTGGAELKVSGFKNVHQVQSKINEFLQKKDSIGTDVNSGQPAKPTIEVTPEQLQFIQKRSAEIESQRQKMDGYTKYGETTLNNVSLQQVYQCIFSDKGTSPLNKNISFFQYTNLKNGNINFKQQKYDKPGPYFYTGENKEITFLNAPLFSSRMTELDHPLPPIPFIPKSCHCKSSERMYWISNKELDFRSQVKSEGAEMMESFLTTTLYKMKQVSENTVSLQMYCKIDFVKQTRMKGILMNGGIGQIKKLIPSIISQIEKCMRAHIKNRNRSRAQTVGSTGGAAVVQEEEQVEDEKVEKTEGKQKLVVNRYLILFVIGTIMINIIINMLF